MEESNLNLKQETHLEVDLEMKKSYFQGTGMELDPHTESKRSKEDEARDQMFIQFLLRIAALEKILLTKGIISQEELATQLTKNLEELATQLSVNKNK